MPSTTTWSVMGANSTNPSMIAIAQRRKRGRAHGYVDELDLFQVGAAFLRGHQKEHPRISAGHDADRLAFQRLPRVGRHALAKDQILAAELLAGDEPEIGNPLIGDDRRIVDAGGREFGLLVLRRSLLVGIGEQHGHLHAEAMPLGMVRNVPDRRGDDPAGRRYAHNWLSAPRAISNTAVAANVPRVALKNSALLQRRGGPPQLRPCDIVQCSACERKLIAYPA